MKTNSSQSYLHSILQKESGYSNQTNKNNFSSKNIKSSIINNKQLSPLMNIEIPSESQQISRSVSSSSLIKPSISVENRSPLTSQNIIITSNHFEISPQNKPSKIQEISQISSPQNHSEIFYHQKTQQKPPNSVNSTSNANLHKSGQNLSFQVEEKKYQEDRYLDFRSPTPPQNTLSSSLSTSSLNTYIQPIFGANSNTTNNNNSNFQDNHFNQEIKRKIMTIETENDMKKDERINLSPFTRSVTTAFPTTSGNVKRPQIQVGSKNEKGDMNQIMELQEMTRNSLQNLTPGQLRTKIFDKTQEQNIPSQEQLNFLFNQISELQESTNKYQKRAVNYRSERDSLAEKLEECEKAKEILENQKQYLVRLLEIKSHKSGNGSQRISLAGAGSGQNKGNITETGDFGQIQNNQQANKDEGVSQLKEELNDLSQKYLLLKKKYNDLMIEQMKNDQGISENQDQSILKKSLEEALNDNRKLRKMNGDLQAQMENLAQNYRIFQQKEKEKISKFEQTIQEREDHFMKQNMDLSQKMTETDQMLREIMNEKKLAQEKCDAQEKQLMQAQLINITRERDFQRDIFLAKQDSNYFQKQIEELKSENHNLKASHENQVREIAREKEVVVNQYDKLLSQLKQEQEIIREGVLSQIQEKDEKISFQKLQNQEQNQKIEALKLEINNYEGQIKSLELESIEVKSKLEEKNKNLESTIRMAKEKQESLVFQIDQLEEKNQIEQRLKFKEIANEKQNKEKQIFRLNSIISVLEQKAQHDQLDHEYQIQQLQTQLKSHLTEKEKFQFTSNNRLEQALIYQEKIQNAQLEREIRVVQLEYEGKLFYLENHIKLLSQEILMWKERSEAFQKEVERSSIYPKQPQYDDSSSFLKDHSFNKFLDASQILIEYEEERKSLSSALLEETKQKYELEQMLMELKMEKENNEYILSEKLNEQEILQNKLITRIREYQNSDYGKKYQESVQKIEKLQQKIKILVSNNSQVQSEISKDISSSREDDVQRENEQIHYQLNSLEKELSEQRSQFQFIMKENQNLNRNIIDLKLKIDSFERAEQSSTREGKLYSDQTGHGIQSLMRKSEIFDEELMISDETRKITYNDSFNNNQSLTSPNFQNPNFNF